ncbi:hypothetical protein [Ammoniphilus sp. YIM 78166]|uniref:hypothetical protein n=1 Tax=Ammoniphilus sp. YIM 78166 TaxID=1644106 RepID=UPI0014308333|nr:hypothetical protein [Ammoniphilus sp. YIM 78166]
MSGRKQCTDLSHFPPLRGGFYQQEWDDERAAQPGLLGWPVTDGENSAGLWSVARMPGKSESGGVGAIAIS